MYNSANIYRKLDVMQMLGISQSTLGRYMKIGAIPAPEKLSARNVYWPKEVIDNWLAEQIKKNSKK